MARGGEPIHRRSPEERRVTAPSQRLSSAPLGASPDRFASSDTDPGVPQLPRCAGISSI